MKKRQTIFISDLHLSDQNPTIATLFMQFLDQNSQKFDALYILGDFFESWIGDDDLTPFHQNIINTLRKATQAGLPIYILHGNRDFLLGKRFMNETGCEYINDETVIDVYGTNVLLLHGDTLCKEDVNYLRFRKVVRNKWVQKLFLSLPLSTRRTIAARMRNKSKQYTQQVSATMMDVTPAEVIQVLKKHELSLMIHGHTHRPCVHDNRIVLAAWHERGHLLRWDEDGQREMVYFS